jgi:membrane peptidoglycan carboxypeptidase
VPLSKVSRWMRLAVVDTEDTRFWRHGGVDWLAVARAAAGDLERGRGVEAAAQTTSPPGPSGSAWPRRRCWPG